MAQAPAEASGQSGVQFTFGSAVAAGTLIRVTDADGTVVASFVPVMDTASLIYSAPEFTAGETYTVYTGGSEGSLAGTDEGGTGVAGEYAQGFRPGF